MSLESLGFCMNIGHDVHEDLKEYQEEYAHTSWKKEII